GTPIAWHSRITVPTEVPVSTAMRAADEATMARGSLRMWSATVRMRGDSVGACARSVSSTPAPTMTRDALRVLPVGLLMSSKVGIGGCHQVSTRKNGTNVPLAVRGRKDLPPRDPRCPSRTAHPAESHPRHRVYAGDHANRGDRARRPRLHLLRPHPAGCS